MQLGKKRHVGNDVLCVVFTDQPETTFSPSWIKSQFIYAYILVQVLPDTPDSRMNFKVTDYKQLLPLYILYSKNDDELNYSYSIILFSIASARFQ